MKFQMEFIKRHDAVEKYYERLRKQEGLDEERQRCALPAAFWILTNILGRTAEHNKGPLKDKSNCSYD